MGQTRSQGLSCYRPLGRDPRNEVAYGNYSEGNHSQVSVTNGPVSNCAATKEQSRGSGEYKFAFSFVLNNTKC